jgi:hypothetical protein
MAEIKCPNCGKLNPSFADTCMDCHAPLLPPASDLPENAGDDIPEWLQRIRERTQTEEGAKSALVEEPVAPFTPGDLPDWLKELKEEKISKNAPPPPSSDDEQAQQDWLEKLRTSPVYDRESVKTGPLPEISDDPQKSSRDLWGPENGDEVPDWLKAATHSGQNAINDFVFPKQEETSPDDITAPVPVVEPKPNPFAQDVSSLTRPMEKEEEADFLSSLTASAAPDWMENARPAEKEAEQAPLPFIPDQSGQSVSEGGSTYSPDFFQTSALTNRIQLSEKQRLNVTLLKNIITNEAEPRSVAPSTPKKQGRAGLLVVSILTILILLGVMLVAPVPFGLPQMYPIEVASLYNQVSALPENSAVLVAVDFDPALAAEMQMSSSALLGHLMTRNARLTLVSTRPSGPMLADALVRSILPGQPQYQSADHILNLGFLPGDAAGLRNFAQAPKAAAPYTFDLQRAWETFPLQGVNLLSDFSAVVVITDNAEVLRSWVEQAQPALGQTPLFVVTSAQAGPLMQPYYDSGQIRGGLSGLSGGAMYSQILGRPGLADAYLNAFQVGTILAVLALVGGGFYHAMAALFSKSRDGGVE